MESANLQHGTESDDFEVQYALARKNHRSKDSFDFYLKAAEQGHRESQRWIGRFYTDGISGIVPQNVPLAVHWLRKAADQGDRRAWSDLAELYRYGKQDIAQNPQLAFSWYKKIAEDDEPDDGMSKAFAQNTLAECYRCGFGVNKNDAEAFRWYKEAVDNGCYTYRFRLGLMYASGTGTPVNEAEYVRLVRLEAEDGDRTAQEHFGLMYSVGKVVAQDDDEALRWLLAAADQGMPRSQYYVARHYHYGLAADVRKSCEEAFEGEMELEDEEFWEWYHKAAEQGDADSQYEIGLIYDTGLWCPRNVPLAKEWYLKAAKQGHEAAREALKVLAG